MESKEAGPEREPLSLNIMGKGSRLLLRELVSVHMNQGQDAARRPADLVCVLQDHGDAEVVVPDHRKALTQQQDDVAARLHHLKVRLISQGPLNVHLKEEETEN